VTDEDARTFWLAGTNRPGEWLTLDLLGQYDVTALQINYTDFRSGIFASDTNVYTQFRMYHSPDGSNWSLIADLTNEKRDRPNAYIELKQSVKTRYLKYVHEYVASPNLAISDLRVFGHGPGTPPDPPRNLQVRRDSDERNAFIAWDEVPGSVGYNVLWGIKPDKLYQTYQVFTDQGTKLELRALTVGQGYYFAVEAFNENGVSKRSECISVQ
jgi:hypothetical protein